MNFKLRIILAVVALNLLIALHRARADEPMPEIPPIPGEKTPLVIPPAPSESVPAVAESAPGGNSTAEVIGQGEDSSVRLEGSQGYRDNRGMGPGLFIGYEETLLKPHFTNAPGIPQDLSSLSMLTTVPFTTAPSEFRYEGAPRVWLGYVNDDGLGFQVRYWEFIHDAQSETAFNFPATGLNTTLEGGLRDQTLDFEALQRVDFGNWEFQFMGGIRYAKSKSFGDLSLRSPSQFNSNIILTELLTHQRTFEGFGPTVGIEARRPIGDTHFALVTTGRFSLLFGDSTDDNLFLNANQVPTTRNIDEDSLLPMIEIQVGPEWSYITDRGTRWFARAVLEGQLWEGAGSIASGNGDMGFFGASFAGGFTH